MDANKRVSVSVRVRPKLEGTHCTAQTLERYEKEACLALSDSTIRLWDGKLTKDSRSVQFEFDNVFPMESGQEEVYEAAAVDAVDAVLHGSNSSILTYGQTGSGKTYTVLGGIESNPLNEDRITGDTGILLRATQEILHYAERVRQTKTVLLGISAVEIYLDEVRDLLFPKGDKAAPIPLTIFKDIIRLPNLTVIPLESLQDVYNVFQLAVSRRVQRATEANDTSSRSHAIFSLEVFQFPSQKGSVGSTFEECVKMKEKYQVDSVDPTKAMKPFPSSFFPQASNSLLGSKAFPIMQSKLTIADLAGSEKSKHSKATGESFEQLKKINASLTALGNVVHSLYQGSKHIPYRDSKLTVVLRESFAAPNATIALIVNVSPTVLTVEESLSSLYFADKVKAIQTLSTKVDPAMVKLQSDYIASLLRRDVLLADLHICMVENEVTPTELHGAWVSSAGPNPARIHIPDSAAKEAAILKAAKELRRAALHRSHQRKNEESFLEEKVRECVKLEIQSYKERRKETEKELAVFESNASSAEREDAEKIRSLEIKLQEVRSRDNPLPLLNKQKEELNSELRKLQKKEEELHKQESFLMEQYTDKEARQSQLLIKPVYDQLPLEDAEWKRCSAVAKLLLQKAKLNAYYASLLSDNAALSQHRDPPKRYQKRDVTMNEWIRHAVWAMAGNAVMISLKNSMRAARPDPANIKGISNLPVNTLAGKKYWSHERLRKEREMAETKGSRGRKKTSVFDDPTLMDTILSFMDMGSKLQRVGKNGKLHHELFYVIKGKEGHYRLCWDSTDPRKQLTDHLQGRGYVDVNHISQIILGQSSPLFSRCAEAGPATVFLSFSLLYHDHKRNLKYLDIVCNTVTEVEWWVIGLSKLSGKWPSYEVVGLPENDNGMGADIAPLEGMMEEEAKLCQQWCIPSAVFVESKSEIIRKCEKKGKTAVSATPGDLRRVTNLDIFRASALWVYFQRKEMVSNPLSTLFCYVDSNEVIGSSAPRSSAETAGITEDFEETEPHLVHR